MEQNNYSSQPCAARAAEPVIPLPNPGEGGPVYPGNDDAQIPVIPLPNPGEGGPVYPGNDDAQIPVIPLPNPGEGGPVYPGNDSSAVPIIPLPNPGEGGPVYPGNTNNSWNVGATILPTLIGALLPGAAKVRFLNAAYNRFVNLLNYASASSYGQVRPGYRMVSIVGPDGYIYLQKSLPFQAGTIQTIAIINTASGMDLLQITDTCCPPGNGYSSFRIGNLAYNSGPLDVRVVYSDLRFKEVGAFKRIMPGTYQFFYADTSMSPMPAYQDIETLDSSWLGVYPPYETFGSLYLNIVPNAIYSVYLLQSGTNRNNIQNLILMDR